MRYTMTRYAKENESEAYRVYVTDTLKVITANVANSIGGAEINERYYDLVHRSVETRSPEEIISGIKDKCKLTAMED